MYGAEDRNRTGTSVNSLVFETSASASSATSACNCKIYYSILILFVNLIYAAKFVDGKFIILLLEDIQLICRKMF